MSMDPELLRIGVGGVVPVQWNLEKSDEETGTLTGWASVYNVVDLQDDVVAPGAFRKTISEWRGSKRVIPLTLDHQNTAEGVIGSLAKAEDTAYGLKTTFRFSSTPDAQNARTKAREGHLNGLSIFGPIVDKAFDDVAGRSVRVLKQVGLSFVGLTPMPANTGSLVLAAKAVSDKPWSNFTEADYTPEQWKRACLIDTGVGDTASKARYKLPVKEPNGAINRNGVHAAAARLNQVQAPAEKKAAAARALIRMYGELGEDPPDSLRRMAGMASSTLSLPGDWVADMRSALSIAVPEAQKAAVDVLVKSQYSAVLETAVEIEEPAVLEEPVADASEYALGLVGELPSVAADPVEELLAMAGQGQTSMDLDALEKELNEG